MATVVKFFRFANGSLTRKEAGGFEDDQVPKIPTPEGATEISEAEYTAEIEGIEQADAEAARVAAAAAEEAAKASAVARKKAFKELTKLGLTPATAKLLLGID